MADTHSNENATIERIAGWWFVTTFHGPEGQRTGTTVSRWASLDLAKLEYRVITGKEWTDGV